MRYSYDEANQMVKFETKGTQEQAWTEKARNVYNGEGMRIRQYEDGKDWAKQYFYVGGALTITTDGTNENFVKSENIIDPSGTILAARKEAKAGEAIEGDQYWVYHYDAQGSVTNIVGVKDNALYRAEENVYDAFGNEEKDVKQSVSSVQNEIKFTGASLDNSGTYYLGSRHYDPNTGRFLQQDTFKGDAYSPWTQNLYTYTSNNPVNYVDPTGHIISPVYIEPPRIFERLKGERRLNTRNTKPTEKTKENRGMGFYTREIAVMMMECEIKSLAAEEHQNAEYWAFVYQGEDGRFYWSNPRRGMGKMVEEKMMRKELDQLGLLTPEGGSTVAIDFFHTHMKDDERNYANNYIVGIDKKGEAITVNKKDGYDVYTKHGSTTDWKSINSKKYGSSNIKLNSFTIIAPDRKGGWQSAERKELTGTVEGDGRRRFWGLR